MNKNIKPFLYPVFFSIILSLVMGGPRAAHGQEPVKSKEIHVKVFWGNQPVDNMKIYLLNSDLNFIKEAILEDKTGAIVTQESFDDIYKYSTDSYLDLQELDDHTEQAKETKILIEHLIETIDLYRIGGEIPHLNGETFINVKPGEKYYLIVLKNNGIYQKDKPFIFWMKEIYLQENVYQGPKEILLNQANANIWE